MCLLKAISGIFIYKQGRWALDAVKPILKEYQDAETGKTQGIKMADRRSKKLDIVKKDVKRLTCGMIAFVFFCVCYCENYMVSEASRWLDQYYLAVQNPNMTTPYGQEYIDAGYKSLWGHHGHGQWGYGREESPDNFPTDNDADYYDDFYPIIEDNETDFEPMPRDDDEFEPEFTEPDFDTPEEHDHHGKFGKQPANDGNPYSPSKHHHKREQKEDLGEWLDSVGAEEAKMQAKSLIDFGMFMGFVWGICGLVFWQMVFICAINHTMKAQKKLETRFMGADHPPVQVHHALPVAPQPQPYVAYAAVSQ